jgi:hypothetical protein
MKRPDDSNKSWRIDLNHRSLVLADVRGRVAVKSGNSRRLTTSLERGLTGQGLAWPLLMTAGQVIHEIKALPPE